MGIAAHLVQHFELFKSDGHIKVELDLTLIDLTHLMESRRIMRRKLASPISTKKNERIFLRLFADVYRQLSAISDRRVSGRKRVIRVGHWLGLLPLRLPLSTIFEPRCRHRSK